MPHLASRSRKRSTHPEQSAHRREPLLQATAAKARLIAASYALSDPHTGGMIVNVRRIGRALLTAVLAGCGAYLALGRLMRPWYSRWGATDEEVRRSLPGDELVPSPRAQ